jgi:hypothetical protein
MTNKEKALGKTAAAKAVPTAPEAKAPVKKTKATVPAPVTEEVATPTPEPKKSKTIKVNSSASYIGFGIIGKDEKTVNFRQGKNNTVTCNGAKCINANATGRRLTVTFQDAKGNTILERKVFKEYFEKMAQVFEVELPE